MYRPSKTGEPHQEARKILASLGSVGAALFPWLAGNLVQAIGLWFLLPYVIILTVFMLCLWIALQARPKVTGNVTSY